MKVHNLGSDYAYQKKLKEQENQPAAVIEQPETTIKSEKNVGDQVPGWGEGVADDTPAKSLPKKNKTKKEAGAENGQPENDC